MNTEAFYIQAQKNPNQLGLNFKFKPAESKGTYKMRISKPQKANKKHCCVTSKP